MTKQEQASKEMENYFDKLLSQTRIIEKVANKARKKNLDPETTTEILVAENMAERVVGLISVAAQQIRDSGVEKRIQKLEQEYGVLDWRVALTIAKEIALQKFCNFETEKEAMEIGIRTGFAYITLGVVSSPLEGFMGIELMDRNDGKGKYFKLKYSGPIRNAGGTAAAVSAIIADYVRKEMGYKTYDPTPKEIKRTYIELQDYHDRITNLQYFPSEEEAEYLTKMLPIQIGGDPTEKFEVSNYKGLKRISTDKLRSGFCLLHSSCIPLKAPKLWRQLQKWGSDFGLENWNFLEHFLEIQHKSKMSGEENKDEKKEEKVEEVKEKKAEEKTETPVKGE